MREFGGEHNREKRLRLPISVGLWAVSRPGLWLVRAGGLVGTAMDDFCGHWPLRIWRLGGSGN